MIQTLARLKIRNAVKEDLLEILEIYNDVILHTTAVYSYTPHTLAMREEWWAQKVKDGYPVVVATLDGKVAGFGCLGSFRNWDAYQYTAETSIYVDAGYRQKGIGKLLYSRLSEIAVSGPWHVLIAGIDADNTASIKLHENLGFKEAGHFKEVGFKFDRWLDLVLMQLQLPDKAGNSN
jgi:L-amino acid N-acyltransferase YncA